MYTHSEDTRIAATQEQPHWNTRSSLLAAAATLALTAGTAFAANQPTLGVSHAPGFGAVVSNLDHHSPFGIQPLWNQLAVTSGNAIVSQNFTSGVFTAFNAQGADDFVIPDKQFWVVTEIDAKGSYFNGAGPAKSFDVYFYRDANGEPGWQVASCHQARYVPAGGFVRIPFVWPYCSGLDVRGDPGPFRYWVSIVANMSFANGGEWGWNTINALKNDQNGNPTDPSEWENRNGGFGIAACRFWGQTTQQCIPGGEGPDYSFALQGVLLQFPSHGRRGFEIGRGK
jgi:hypothetical protein